MKKSLVALAVFATLIIAACSKNNNPLPNPGGSNESDTLKGKIEASRTLKAGRIYYISGPAIVKNNAVLTIEAGAVIKGIKGTKAVLIITRGSKIMAQGTADKPIVFTSNQPAGQRAFADWGGVVLLGKAKVNTAVDGVANRRVVEGFDPAEVASLKDDIIGGGEDDNDNSGVMQYCRIEFAGIALSLVDNSELNALTFIGVGKQTVIDHIQASFGGDDAFEWFGGTVNAKYLVSYRTLDDDFDSDNGFTGRVQFGVAIRDKDMSDKNNSSGASNGFESDNDKEGTDNAPFTAPVFSNFTFVGPWAINNGAGIGTNVFRRGAHIRLNSRLSIYNSVIAGFPTGILIDGDKSSNATAAELDIRNTFVGVASVAKLEGKVVNATLNVKTWFMTADRANDTTYNNADDFKFAKVSGVAANLSDIDVRPVTGSPLIGKGAFTAGKSTDAFFTKVTYAGAFSIGDTWMQGWTNFDPNSASY